MLIELLESLDLNFVTNKPRAENARSLSIDVGGILIRALYSKSRFGVRFPVASYRLNSFSSDLYASSLVWVPCVSWDVMACSNLLSSDDSSSPS